MQQKYSDKKKQKLKLLTNQKCGYTTIVELCNRKNKKKNQNKYIYIYTKKKKTKQYKTKQDTDFFINQSFCRGVGCIQFFIILI